MTPSKLPRFISILTLLALLLVACGGGATTPAPTLVSEPNVAILIIDDFKPVPEKVDMDQLTKEREELKGPPPNDLSPSPQDNCIVTTDGQYFSGQGASGSAWPSPTPHGQLVYEELQYLIKTPTNLQGNLSSSSPTGDGFLGSAEGTNPWMKTVDTWTTISGTIYLVEVDTDRYTTKAVSARINEAVNLFTGKNITHFVLNMSFAIVPCHRGDDAAQLESYKHLIDSDTDLNKFKDLLDAFSQQGLSEDDRNALLLFGPEFAMVRNHPQIARVSLTEFYGPSEDYLKQNGKPDDSLSGKGGKFESDPLLILLKGYQNSTGVISVAAAGNSGYSFPFAPALWSSVVSVSADPRKEERKEGTFVANSGEVAMDPHHPTETVGQSGPPLIGTSFAAPRLSLQAALYLLGGGQVNCSGSLNPNNPISPPMAYAPYEGPNKPNPPFWANLPLKDAASDYCSNFPIP